MYSSFPRGLVRLLRCPRDSGELDAVEPPPGDRVGNGALKCRRCGSSYPVVDGILCLLDPNALDDESAHEQRLRDEGAGNEYQLTTAYPVENAMEMPSTLGALRPRQGVVLELGCGTGRYTTVLARDCESLLALDFSIASLKILASRLAADANVGLIHGDVTQFRTARAFSGCLSTLVSNLPTTGHREAMFRTAGDCLAEGGRFVFSTHFHNLRDRLARRPQAGRYSDGGIYRYYFRRNEILAETRRHFARVAVRPIMIGVPFARRLGCRFRFCPACANTCRW